MNPIDTKFVVVSAITARRVVGLVLLAILFWQPRAFAQLTTGTISGTVMDQTKATLPGAEVNVRNVGTGLVRTVFANENGRFEAPNLPIGAYEVTAALSGFGTAVRRDIQLTIGRTIVLDLTLPLASVQQEVVVTGAAPLVEVTSATVSNLIDGRRVEDLPIVNRDLTQLTYLQPGVIKIPSSGTQGVFGGMGDKFSVAGARGTQNLYLLDGVSNADLSGNAQGSSGALMGVGDRAGNPDRHQQLFGRIPECGGRNPERRHQVGHQHLQRVAVRVLSQRRARRGRITSTRSSTARSPTSNATSSAFSLGGPIMRDRLFFFGSYEGLREEQGKTDTALVPSMNARQGRLANGRTVTVNPAMVRYLALYPVPGQSNSIVQDFGDTVLIAGAFEPGHRQRFRPGQDRLPGHRRAHAVGHLQLRPRRAIAIRDHARAHVPGLGQQPGVGRNEEREACARLEVDGRTERDVAERAELRVQRHRAAG